MCSTNVNLPPFHLTTSTSEVSISQNGQRAGPPIPLFPPQQEPPHPRHRQPHLPRHVQMHRCRSYPTSSNLVCGLHANNPHQEENVVLGNAFEYRRPSEQQARAAAAASASSGTVKLDMTSRYLGLVVVPGQHIVKIEVEHFADQELVPSSRFDQPAQSAII